MLSFPYSFAFCRLAVFQFSFFISFSRGFQLCITVVISCAFDWIYLVINLPFETLSLCFFQCHVEFPKPSSKIMFTFLNIVKKES
ncbi:uncharacterized protein BX663DRAFT_140894 [Cokeromyces recurvatus]|uniref:uncharacterized protein n=1 Tax=Cokeromyces recurvatus TaxID=90255 RepID=UPI00221F8490|nr:uncharacterized protein BX663DRAFT_140894 [Cokeromyces recurvatus]KAI7900963.1 hypothetical protein BX663DRAFT_140894 [Cokeromyces recurvatus]